MSTRRHRRLSEEDRIVWSIVARSVTPLPGKALPPADDSRETVPRDADNARQEKAVRPSDPPPSVKPPAAAFDRPVRDKLAKGRLPLDARIDLHGLTQQEAHGLLLSFLHRAHAAGARHVLVITGKGASFGSEGVLRRAVPEWLRTPAFRGLVSAHEDAARKHGGSGALYVRLRRPGARQ